MESDQDNKEGVMVRPTWNQTNPLLTRKVTLEDIMKTRQKQKERVVDIMETNQLQHRNKPISC